MHTDPDAFAVPGPGSDGRDFPAVEGVEGEETQSEAPPEPLPGVEQPLPPGQQLPPPPYEPALPAAPATTELEREPEQAAEALDTENR
jgi:hypothetical protein